MALGEKIRQARLEAGLSQRQLCGQQITRNMLSQIENGTATPSMETMRYLAAQLGKPVGYFLEETAASPNQGAMDTARAAFAAGHFHEALQALADFSSPDPIFDWEKHLLQALACISLAEASGDLEYLRQATDAGKATPYYTPELERRRLLCLCSIQPDQISQLPSIDGELLLRAETALAQGDFPRALALLEAAEDRTALRWILLRADAAFAAEEYKLAASYYLQAEAFAPETACPKLEQCYLLLEDYKMAYLYAKKSASLP